MLLILPYGNNFEDLFLHAGLAIPVVVGITTAVRTIGVTLMLLHLWAKDKARRQAGEKPNAPWYIKAFVVFHLFCITVWATPAPQEAVRTGKAKPLGSDYLLVWNDRYLKTIQPLRTYLFVSGFWQYWDMFAPNPAQIDFWVDSEVIYRDGTKKYYLYPRMFLLPLPNKYAQERYRKYFERANDEGYTYLWPLFARRIAYLNDNPKNPPVSVRLTRHWYQVMPPDKPQWKDYNKFMYYEYAVDQKELQKMRNMWP
ncbi:hypothetical protein OP10G_0036 [Fimbriimonas ginsengisoli Gsoil 348]|uniref:Uncharacterized protein n=1 Tax=Fimbriimonas ginsengisoli Gsoil 348 TaxID=661478 RepID=A0A068NP89_FIMGI|nr:hypothetical protein OP10G_0036 [Fimbriimonas ginsengisoli Gsoil 348]